MTPPTVSFEFFPPKTDKSEEALWQTIEVLEALSPAFVSVTYGAGGSTRDRTHRLVKNIADNTSLIPAAHLTCVAASREEVDNVAHGYWQAGIKHVVALRGDPPKEMVDYQPHPQGYVYSTDLVKGLKTLHDFEVSVAAFPEKHPSSASFEHDIEVLKMKQDAGATRAITQYFFDTEHYAKLLERTQKAGITIPIVPGILPIGNFGQAKKFSAMCGTSVPAWVHERFEGLDERPEARDRVAVYTAVRQCEALMALGVDHFHFYTLNRADLTYAICWLLGVRPQER